jgi:hypothetical protein
MRPILLVAIVLVASIAGCSGDDEPSAVDAGDETSETSGPTDDATSAPTGDTDTSEGTVPGATSEFCAAVQQVQELDNASNDLMNEMIVQGQDTSAADLDASWAAAREELRSMIPDLNAAYDAMAASAPDAIADEVPQLQEASVVLLDAIIGLESIGDLAALEQTLDPAMLEQAVSSTFAIDAVTRTECDIVFAD